MASLSEPEALLDRVLCETLGRRIGQLGETNSGAYNFYAARVTNKSLFSHYDLAISDFLAGNLPSPVVIEIGTGVGQLPLLLAVRGFRVIGIESDRRRYEASMDLLSAAEQRFPEIAGHCQFMFGKFPDVPSDPNLRATVLSTNLVFTTPPEVQKRIVARMMEFETAIVDIDRLFFDRTSEDERNDAISMFTGLRAHARKIESLSKVGNYWLFHKDSTTNP